MMNTQLSSLTRITYSTAYKCEASSAMAIFPTAFFFDNLILLLEQLVQPGREAEPAAPVWWGGGADLLGTSEDDSKLGSQ